MFLYSLPHLLQTIERLNVFFKNIYFRVFKFSIFIAIITINFHHFNLDSTEKNVISLFFLYSLGRNNLVYFKEFFSFNLKLINPIQKY